MVEKKQVNEGDNTLPDANDPSKIDPDVFNGIAKCAELMGIQLIESHFSIAPSYFDVADDDAKLKLDVVDQHGSFDEESRIVTCIFQFESVKKKGNKKLLTIKDRFVAFYHIPLECDECDEFHAVSFARRTGVMACYPYFRSHAAQTSALANADMPILPTLSKMPIRRADRSTEVEK